MATACQSSDVRVERGPGWLYVKLMPRDGDLQVVADEIWALATRHFTYRIVLEMDEIAFLPSILMGQLVMLQKRLLQHGGSLRIAGLSAECSEALHLCRLDHVLPVFNNREDAVLRDSIFSHPR